MDRRLLKPLLLVTIVLVVPIALVALRGESFADQIARWQTDPPARGALVALVVAILAADVVLPVPSGPINTLAGSQLGVVLGTAASAAGMTLGAAIAFALARCWGRPLAERLSSDEQLREADRACREHGPWMLVLTRPLPIVAEAAVLVAGGLKMPLRDFAPPVALSNVAIAVTYSVLGQQAAAHGWLPLAVCASVALPLAIALYYRRRLRRS
jgi:uncharacterized membrane protein YdjX (TVP38/TMEM64 family)